AVATMRRATSSWTRTTTRGGRLSSPMNRSRRGVVIWYGTFATMRVGRRSPAAKRSTASASARTIRTLSRPVSVSRRTATIRSSISTAVTDRARSASFAVRTPGPGPTSRTSSAGDSSAASRMACRTRRSTRKRWPSDVAARTPCRRRTLFSSRGSTTSTAAKPKPLLTTPLPRLAISEHERGGVRVRDRIEDARAGVPGTHAVRGPGRGHELEEARGARARVHGVRVVAALAPRDAQQLVRVGAPGRGCGADDRLDVARRGRRLRPDAPDLGHGRDDLEGADERPTGLGPVDDVHPVGVVGDSRDARRDDNGPAGRERGVLDDLDRERQCLANDGVVVGDPDEVDDIAGGDDRVPVVVQPVLRPKLDAVHGEGFSDRGGPRRPQGRDAL